MQGPLRNPKLIHCPECGHDITHYLAATVDLSALKKAKHHSYPLVVQQMALNLLGNLGLSYKVTQGVFICLQEYMSDLTDIPSVGSMHAWNAKRNKAMLNVESCCALEGNYALLTDVSMSVGKRRLLVFLTVCLDEWTFSRPLSIRDVMVVGVFIESSFTGERVAQCIDLVRQSHPGMQVEYLVSDGGGELVKGARLARLPRVSDCHHFFAKELKKEYENDERYKSFMAAVVEFNRKNNMNDNAAVLPPRLGHHSRFMNVGLIVRWAIRLLNWPQAAKQLPELAHFIDATTWLEDHRPIIERLAEVTELGYSMLKVLKHHGLSLKTKAECLEMIKVSGICEQVKQRYRSYFKECPFADFGLPKLAQRSSPLICSTDAMESHFGVLKHRTGKRLNGRCLDITQYGRRSISIATIQLAMERSTIAEAIQWQRGLIGCKVDEDKRMLKTAFAA